jgi:hypothetical protein
MNKDSLQAVKTIFVHGGGCPDGVASAILLHDVLPNATIKFVQYNSEEHLNLKVEPNALFADFTPKEAQVPAWVDAGAIVLDHHKGAKDIVAAFGENGRFGDEETEPGVCGAVLCFRHVWMEWRDDRGQVEENRALDFATLAGIRDTWLRTNPRWNEARAQAEVLRFFPSENWLDILEPFSHSQKELWAERLGLGKLLVERHDHAVKRTLDKAYRFKTDKGTRVMMFEGTGMSSDGSDAAEETDLVIGFGFLVENGIQKMIFSSRSRAGYDCLSLAKAHGGGGHSAAAGFNQDITNRTINPYQLAELLVNEHEAKAQP